MNKNQLIANPKKKIKNSMLLVSVSIALRVLSYMIQMNLTQVTIIQFYKNVILITPMYIVLIITRCSIITQEDMSRLFVTRIIHEADYRMMFPSSQKSSITYAQHNWRKKQTHVRCINYHPR
jgi:hypothetical protein